MGIEPASVSDAPASGSSTLASPRTSAEQPQHAQPMARTARPAAKPSPKPCSEPILYAWSESVSNALVSMSMVFMVASPDLRVRGGYPPVKSISSDLLSRRQRR